MPKQEQRLTDMEDALKEDGLQVGPITMTTEDMLKPKWVQRQKLMASIEVEKEQCKERLKASPWHQRHKEKLKALQMQVELIERSMDQCARLGKQMDYLAESEGDNP